MELDSRKSDIGAGIFRDLQGQRINESSEGAENRSRPEKAADAVGLHTCVCVRALVCAAMKLW